jgi:ethanolamine utilization protein EutJ
MAISEKANKLIEDFEKTLSVKDNREPMGELYAGVDLGTAYIVTAVVNEQDMPVAGVLTRSRSSVRDGLVLDYIGVISILREQVNKIRSAGFPVTTAAVAYPPGTIGRNANAFGNVLESVGLTVVGMLDEPTAASKVLNIVDGAVVDIGGGTTGISVIKDGRVVYTADEATGGTHVDLVLSGHFGIQQQEAERLKREPGRQMEVLDLIRPVFQKMGTIVRNHLQNYPVEKIYLVGGTSCFPGIEKVIAAETGIETVKPVNPLLVTPLGIALGCRTFCKNITTERVAYHG